MHWIFILCFLALTAAHAGSADTAVEDCGTCEEQIAAVEKEFDALPANDPRGAGLLFRLGALHQQAARFHRTASSAPGESLLDHMATDTYSNDSSKAALKQYQRILERYSRFKRRDEVLFHLMGVHLDLAQEDKAQAAYDRLLKEHPKSRFVPEAHLAMADSLFHIVDPKHDRLEEARDAYKKVTGFKNSPNYARALYMRGWCSFLLEDLKDAQAAWKAVAQHLRSTGSKKAPVPGAEELRHAALLDSVYAFSRQGEARKARSHFNELTANSDERILLMALLDLHYRSPEVDKEDQAAVTLAELEKDCQAKKARACNALGLVYEESWRLNVERPGVAEHFQQACKKGHAAACANLCRFEKSCSAASTTKGQDKAAAPVQAAKAASPAELALVRWAPLERLGRDRDPALERLLDRSSGWRDVLPTGLPAEEPAMAEPLPTGEPPPSFVGLDRDSLRAVIRQHSEEIRFCYEQALANTPALEGHVAVRFVGNAEGRVVSSEIARSTVGNEAMESCIAERVKTWVFPKPPGGGFFVVTYPFVFKTSQ